MPRFTNVFLFFFAVIGLLFAALGSAPAQIPLPYPHSRVIQAVDDSRRTTLSGNTHPLARPEFDQGALSDSANLGRIVLVLQRSAQQEEALKQLIDQQQDSASSAYHQWVTPEAFGAAFGPSDRDLSAVTTWLSDRGFSNIEVNAGRTLVQFSGTAGAVRNAFRTSMHRYQVQGQQRFANASDPQIPEALSPVIAGIASLNNFPRRAANHKLGNFRRDPRSNVTTRLRDQTGSATSAATTSNPEYTVVEGTNIFYGVTPYDFAAIYNVLPLWNASAPIDGTGQTIAIVGQTDINPADFVNFRKLFNLPLGNTATPTGTQYLNIIYNGPNPGVTSDEGEADIDTQWSSAVAKGATIDYVVSEGTEVTQGTDLSAIYIVNNNLAPVMSYSYGQCELFLGTAGNAFYNTLWQQAAAQGITVVLATGDSGSAGCDYSGVNYATNGLGINGLGSTPYNVAVGGTDFYMPKGGTAYWSTTNTATQSSVLGYIPEAPWNESCTNSAFATTSIFTGETPEQVCNNITAINNGFLNVVGGGGGASACVHSSGTSPGSCSGGYRKPSWQAGTGVPTDGFRDVPDVSLFAGAGFFGAFYVVCQQSGNPDGQPCSLAAPAYDFAGYGGTSVAAPAFAGILSLVNQKTGTRQGNANYVLYNLASQQNRYGVSCNASTGIPNGSCVFNDITTGSIAMPCLKGGANCTTATSTDRYGVLSGWNSTAGYDLATGLGSVNAANLIGNWTAATFNATSTTLALSSSTIAHGNPVSATVSVTSASGTPSGGVAINALAPNGAVQTLALNDGAYSTTLSNFPGGSYSVSAHYGGDGTYAPSDSNPVTLTVTPEPSTTKLRTLLYNFSTGTTSNVATQPYGNLLLLRADVAGVSGQGTATGNIAFTDGGAPLDGAIFRLNSNGYTEDQTSLLPPGTHTITAAYSGDGSFNASQSVTASFTVTKTPTTAVVISSPASASIGSTFQLSVQILPQSGGYGLPPTGVVTVKAGILTLGFAKLSQLQGGGATITLPANQLGAGTNQFVLTYSGDANYLGSSSTPFNIYIFGSALTASSTTLAVTPSTVTPTGSIQLNAAVTPATSPMPTGTVRFLVDGQNFGLPQPLFGNAATLTIAGNSLSPGIHALAAIYSGDALYQASLSAPVEATISSTAVPSTTTISVVPDTAMQGVDVIVNATISPASPIPTGTAKLLLDGNVYGQPIAINDVTASFPLTTTTLQPGPHVLQVSYSGDTTHLASLSAAATLTILTPVGTFTLSPSTATATASLGAPSTAVVLTATPNGGFRSTITFACTGGLPPGEACQFTPASLSPIGSAALTTTLTIAPTASGKPPQAYGHTSPWFPVGTWATLAGVFLFCIPRRHRLLKVLTLLLAASALSLISGCGSGGIAPIGSTSNNTLTSGTYNITVTATGGSTIQVATVTLTLR